MTDTQIVHNYRLDRESIYELCHELEAELARPTRRVHALPVSIQVMIANTIYVKEITIICNIYFFSALLQKL
jgi:hypothetical protein